jgi:hypothetical protein
MFLPDARAQMYHRAVLLIVAGVTAINAFVTAREFDRSDKLYLSWMFLGAGYVIAATRYGIRIHTLLTGDGITNPLFLTSLLILQNVLVPLSLFLFVRAWRATGLAAPGSAAAHRASIAAGIAGFPLSRGLMVAKADLVLLVSTLGDMISLALIVPLMMPALALRGGSLMNTWAYLTTGIAIWLVYDIWFALRDPITLPVNVERGIEEAIRVTAIMFACIASIAQRRAARG